MIDFPIMVGVLGWVSTILAWLVIVFILKRLNMKIIYNNIIPFKGFKCINICGLLFARKGSVIDEVTLNHEKIHTAQMKEMFYIPFYLWYFIEWVIRLFQKGNAYRNISFEKEAYSNEENFTYLSERKPYAWWKYI